MLQVKPKYVRLKSLTEEIHLLCISDVHHAQDSSSEEELIKDLKEPRPNRLIIGIGDELDSICRADKRHRIEDLKDRFTHKHVYPRLTDAEIEDYGAILEDLSKPEEWLGHISGNHPYVMTAYNTDPVGRLCDMLEHPYLGYSAFVPVVFDCCGQRINFMIVAHHGFGGASSRKEGASFNSYIDHALRYDGWDLALYGHRHDRWAKIVPKIAPQFGGKKKSPLWLKAEDRVVAQCGTYQRTLAHGVMPTYSERMGYTPKPIGALVLRYKFTRGRNKDMDREARLEYLGSNS